VLMLDSVVLARKPGAGTHPRPVLVAFGWRRNSQKELIEFPPGAERERRRVGALPADLILRGLLGDGPEMIGSTVVRACSLLWQSQTGKIAGGRITAGRARFRRPSARARLPRV
jgi:hypothetical protein